MRRLMSAELAKLLTKHRQHRALMRRGAMAYARAFLGVKRLPAGVRALVRDYADTIDTWALLPGLADRLDRYRKPWTGA
jgi:hypothetical protein